jgi:hypothetical protein
VAHGRRCPLGVLVAYDLAGWHNRIEVTLKTISLPAGYERRIPLDLSQPCWPWPGPPLAHGYARVMIDGDSKYAHRLVYQLHVGPIPRGWELDHACHSAAVEAGECFGGACAHRACWNPAHIEAVTSLENSLRGNHPLFAVARRQVCLAGLHDLNNPANVFTRKDGHRRCRPCTLGKQKERRQLSKR